ncbi:MAG: hypothetical protein PHW11_05645 [Anaerolineaceae bacterium]|jgi:hypothetical protein|nr:hypothetical protein [Anaerolineaceae bacterium]MDD4043454.1 hypothetical protein [Anaerolineaceae bacterium]MDD4578668.1 hypothetical protein [Anaerolineaceae bacterium]
MSESSNKTNAPTKKQAYRLYAQFVLVGAALGAYYGIFYRPSDTPVLFVSVVLLSILSALLVTVIQIWKKGYAFKEILVIYLKSFAMFFLFLVMLWARPTVMEWGGKGWLIAFTTLVGGVIGFIMGLKKKPVAENPKGTKK